MKDPRQLLITRLSEVRIRNAIATGDPEKIEEANRLYKNLTLDEVTISNIRETAPGTQHYTAEIDLSQRGGGKIKQYWSPASPTDGFLAIMEPLEYFRTPDNFMTQSVNRPVSSLDYYEVNEVMLLSSVMPFNDKLAKNYFPFDESIVKIDCFSDYVAFSGPFISGLMPVRDGKQEYGYQVDDPDVKVSLYVKDLVGEKETPFDEGVHLAVGEGIESKVMIRLDDSAQLTDGDEISLSYAGTADFTGPKKFTYTAGQPFELTVDGPDLVGKDLKIYLRGPNGFSCWIHGIVFVPHHYTYLMDGTITPVVTYPEQVTGSLKFKPIDGVEWSVPEDDIVPGVYLFDRGNMVAAIEMNTTEFNEFTLPLLEPGSYEMVFRLPGAYYFMRAGYLEVNLPE